ncbi:GbsR/MarR family transcriptional regulator [Virgibacillus sp. CBA3643]|uniref:GbsR/MarR family transcriptional regulator n=1 Tax=Virgibacillus sp. CBA3643 TaxID=2942278 RepID=UPI0035A33D3C
MDNELKQIEESRDILISGIAQSLEVNGVTASAGRIYGVLYFLDKPMSLNEIKDEVAMSKATVSNGLRELLDIEMITKVWKKGDRKDHYIAVKDLVKNFVNFFIKQFKQERNLTLKAYQQALPTLEKIAKHGQSEETKTMAKKDIEAINDSNVYFDWTLRLIEAFETGEIFRYFPLTINKNKQDRGEN